MAVNEGQLKPLAHGELPPDPNVRIPESVKAASAAADAIHQRAYAADPNQAPAPAKEALPQPAQPEPIHQAQPVQSTEQPQPQAQPAHPVEQPAPKPGEENLTADEWRHRFLSMQGRYQAEVRKSGGMEQQMQELGQELVRTQQLVSHVQTQPQTPQSRTPAADHGNLITDEDVSSYGNELIDLTRRVAQQTLAPEIQRLQAENDRLTRRVQNTGRRELFATLDRAVPNWRALNDDVRFKTWLRLPNVYTGQIRQGMLNAAVDGADAPKTIAFFKDFLAEATATGQQAPSVQNEQPAPLAPREPALALDALAAPGKARPASGNSQVSSEKPVYSRAEIKQFYRDKNRGAFAGRDAEVAAFEIDLGLAQREGRIRG